MDWFAGLFDIHSSIQTVIIVSLIISIGLALGKVKVMGISLGVAFVFFMGILSEYSERAFLNKVSILDMGKSRVFIKKSKPIKV